MVELRLHSVLEQSLLLAVHLDSLELVAGDFHSLVVPDHRDARLFVPRI
jgi:hypothetical protein